MVVIDASVIVSVLARNDPHHLPSQAWLHRWQAFGGSILAPMLLSIEGAGTFSRLSGSPIEGYRAVRELRRIPSLRLVPVDVRLERMAIQCAADLSPRGADATYVAVARARKMLLVTWDNEQLQRGARYTSVFTPLTFPWAAFPTT